MCKKTNALPINVPKRGLSRDEAAEYVGVGTTLFDSWVDEVEKRGRKLTYSMGKRKLYDRLRIDAAINEMMDSQEDARDNPYAIERQAA